MDDNNDENKIFWKLSSKEPIPIYLHSNLGLSVSTALSKKIKKHGGNPKATEDEAEVIICRKDGPMFSTLTKKYDHDRYKWVEPPLWVNACISEKKYQHPVKPPVLRSRPGGRSQFTFAEDEHIVRFLAKRIPWRNMKGRSGQSVWKDLCSRTDLYPWAAKHSWQSWRERYVKNSTVFDDRIDAAVLADPDPPVPGGKGQYRVEYGKPGPRNRPQPKGVSCRVEEEEEGEEIDVDGEISNRKTTSVRPSVEMPSPKRRRIEAERREEEEEEERVETSRPGPSNGVSLPIASTSAPIAPTPTAPSVVPPPERSISPPLPPITSLPSSSSPSSSSSSPQQSSPETTALLPRRRKSNISTVVPATSARRTRSQSRPIVPDQTATAPDDNNNNINDDDPPALRTRARSRQVSVEPPPAQPVEPSSRPTKRTRAAASPVPPAPPPTLATQPEPFQMIDFDQLNLQKKRGMKKKVTSKPALIPIPETSETTLVESRSINLDTRGTEPSVHNTPPVEEVQVQPKDTVVPDNDDDDDDEDVQFNDQDLDLDSSDDTSAIRSFNEGMKALTNQAMETNNNNNDENQTPKLHLPSFRARKIPYPGPPLHRKPLFDESDEEDSDEEEDSQDEDESDSESEEGSGGSDSQSSSEEELPSLDTETSVPAVGTNARKYVISRTPFTPARGTLAEKRVVENHKWNLRDRKVDKGKGRA